MASGLWGIQQWGTPHKICLSNMLSLFAQAFLTMSCRYKDRGSLICKQKSHQGGTQGRKCCWLPWRILSRERSLTEKIQFSCDKPRGWYRWEFQEVLESLRQWHVWTQERYQKNCDDCLNQSHPLAGFKVPLLMGIHTEAPGTVSQEQSRASLGQPPKFRFFFFCIASIGISFAFSGLKV